MKYFWQLWLLICFLLLFALARLKNNNYNKPEILILYVLIVYRDIFAVLTKLQYLITHCLLVDLVISKDFSCCFLNQVYILVSENKLLG